MSDGIITAIRALDDDGGFVVDVDGKPHVEITVDTYRQCCEGWGSISTPDDTQKFVGSKFIGVGRVGGDDQNNVRYGDYYNTMFVDIKTSLGVLQLTVYNEHNGYYSHYAKITVGGEVLRSEYL